MKDTVWETLITGNPHRIDRMGGRLSDVSEGGNVNHNYLIDVDCSNPSSSAVTTPGAIDNCDDTHNLVHQRNSFSEMKEKSKNKSKRLVKKSGGLNFKITNIEDKGERYVGDFFTTLVDIRWRWTLTYFIVSYVLSWFVFAIIWWVVVRGHGDMDHFEEEGWNPCVVGVKSFSSIFLFSLETQHTIGYGYHRMTDECPEAIFLLVVQSITGVIIEGLTAGVFIVKLSRSKKRTQTIVFSKFAAICQKDDALCLMFRVADVGKSLLLEAHIRAQIITKTLTKSGKILLCQQAIELEADDQDEDRLLLFWPTTIFHEINEESPLYSMNSSNFSSEHNDEFELVVVLEGIVESTGMTTQARTSYLPSEILWGRQFTDMVQDGERQLAANMEQFHTSFPIINMSPYSAKELKQLQETSSENSSTNGNS